MLTNIDLEKMNHLMETNKDAKEIITQLLKNHDAAVATIAHEIRNPMTVLYSSMQLMSSLYAQTAKGSCVWEECMDGARHMCDLLDDRTQQRKPVKPCFLYSWTCSSQLCCSVRHVSQL